MADVYLARNIDLARYGLAGSRAVALVAVDVPLETAQDLEGLTGEERARLAEDLRSDVDIAVGLSTALRNRRMRQRGPLAS